MIAGNLTQHSRCWYYRHPDTDCFKWGVVTRARVLTGATVRRVAEACAEGANPLPETGYKVDLVVATVIETLERLRAAR